MSLWPNLGQGGSTARIPLLCIYPGTTTMNLKLLTFSLGLSLLLGLLLTIWPAQAQGQTFYVDPTGSDTTGTEQRGEHR